MRNKRKKNRTGQRFSFTYLIIKLLIVMSIISSLPAASFALIGIREGDVPKEFTLPDLNGSLVNSGDYFGSKPVIIVFWELAMSKSFLDYSMDELRFLNDFYEKHHDKSGLEIFAIYTPEEDREIPESEIERVKNLIKVNRIKFPVLIDTGFKIFREYGVIALPSTLMIDKTGKIKFIYPSFPLASQPLFTEEIKSLIGIIKPAPDMEAKNADGPGSHSDRLYSYAHQMYKRGLVEQALSPLKKSMQMAPEYAPSHNLMGIILWKIGNLKDAADEFELAIKLDKNNAPAYFNYGLLLFENDKYAEAEAHIKSAVSLNNNLAEAHYVLGMIYKKRKHVSDALKELEEALTLFDKKKKTPALYDTSDYNRISVLYSLSKLYAENGDYKKALDLLIKATQVSLGLEDKEETDHLHRSGDLMIYE